MCSSGIELEVYTPWALLLQIRRNVLGFNFVSKIIKGYVSPPVLLAVMNLIYHTYIPRERNRNNDPIRVSQCRINYNSQQPLRGLFKLYNDSRSRFDQNSDSIRKVKHHFRQTFNFITTRTLSIFRG